MIFSLKIHPTIAENNKLSENVYFWHIQATIIKHNIKGDKTFLTDTDNSQPSIINVHCTVKTAT